MKQKKHMRWKGVLMVAIFFGALLIPIGISTSMASADNIPSFGAVTLWDTESFYGNYGSHPVFTGDAFYFYIEYPNGESNPDYNWYIVGVLIQRSNTNGNYAVDIGGIQANEYISSNNVWDVEAQPIYKTPLSGSGTFSVGYDEAGVSITLEPNGYDYGTMSSGNAATSGEYQWNHDYTMADQNSWNQIDAAYLAKVSAQNSGANVEGSVNVYFYMWWTGGWNPLAGTSSWITATYDSGASSSVTYPYYV